MTPVPSEQHLATWQQAQDVLLWLQIDAAGLGGVWLRSPHGPMRDLWLQGLQNTQAVLHKVPTHTEVTRLLGGVDLSSCLQTGQWVMQQGLLEKSANGVVLLPMAERQPVHQLALVTQGQDQHRYGVVALDESDPDDPPLPARLQDRLGLWLDLRDLPYQAQATEWLWLSDEEVQATRARLQHIQASDAQLQSVCAVAQALGVQSLRALHITLRLASILAALDEQNYIDQVHLEQALRCVLLPRATQLPEAPSSEQERDDTPVNEAPPSHHDTASSPDTSNTTDPTNTPQDTALEDVLLAATIASLPTQLLEKLAAGNAQRLASGTQGSSGQSMASRHRGRPLAPRKGSPHSGARLHVLATLRAAVPHQKWRTKVGSAPLAIRTEDFHVHRFAQKSATCLIVAIDASGSAAMERLAQAKGAVELLLNQSYARRDSVCVIAFRGTQAQILLPPSRSLVRAKKALANLPGGGGTPLATGLQQVYLQAHALQHNGVTPLLVVLSDGRANVTLAGVGGREQAHQESVQWAQSCARMGLAALWIDTGLQANGIALSIAQAMHAHYLHMPRVESHKLASAMQTLNTSNAANASSHVA
jgi:magnesium chelatase subunit D